MPKLPKTTKTKITKSLVSLKNDDKFESIPKDFLQLIMLENIIAIMPGHVYWKSRDGKYLGCNEAQAKALNLSSRHDIINHKPYENLSRKKAALLRKIDAQVMVDGKTITAEEPGIREDGTIGVFLTKKTPLYDENKNIIGLIGVSFDITDKKIAEENRIAMEKKIAEEQRIKAEREEEIRRAISIFAGSIAHDLRNPLTSLLFLVNLFTDEWLAFSSNPKYFPDKSDDITILEQLRNIDDFPAKMKNVIHDMNEFITLTLKSMQRLVTGSLSQKDFSICEIEPCLHDILNKFPFHNGERELVQQINIDNFQFLVHPVLFYRILFNLITNSLQQIKKNKKGQILISTDSNEKNHLLRIKDTAGGAAPEIVDQLFYGYKTTKKEGTGIGLAFCKLTMQSFGGDINCTSIEGDFIEFILSFPKLETIDK
ncbi:MAG: ATP-binding protein [Gammaproteobacteria bacterium]